MKKEITSKAYGGCVYFVTIASLARRIVATVARYVCLHSYMVASKGHVLVKCGDRMTAIKTSRRWCALVAVGAPRDDSGS